jgi:hypothetical protein
MIATSGHLAMPATNFSTSALGVTPPVGLAGELMMISLVF